MLKTKSEGVLRRFKTNFFWTLLNEVVGKGAVFFSNIYLARELSVSDYGLFVVVQAVTTYLWVVVDLGTGLYGIRELAAARDSKEKIANSLLSLRFSFGISMLLLALVVLSLLNMPLWQKVAYGIGMTYVVFYSFYTDWVFKGMEKFQYIIVGNLATASSLFGGLIILFEFIGKKEYAIQTALGIWSGSYLVGGIVLILMLTKKTNMKVKFSISFRDWGRHLSKSVYFSLSGIFLTFSQYAPLLLLNYFFSSHAVGIFSAPYRLVLSIITAGFMLGSSYYPILSQLYCDRVEEFHGAFKRFRNLVFAVGFIAFVGLLIGAESIVAILYGAKYSESVNLLRLLSLLIPVTMARAAFGIGLLASRRQEFHTISSVSSTGFALLLGGIFIPTYGTHAAIVVLLAGETVAVLLLNYFLRKSTISDESKFVFAKRKEV